jgi:ribosomal protein S18 acetylase RimI-like enzyme
VLNVDERAPVGQPRAALLGSRVLAGEVLIFEERGRLLAYAVVRSKSFFGRDFVELLCVGTEERRRGIGGRLLDEAVATASSERIFTSTNESNTAMRGLLQRQRWHLSGKLEGMDEHDPELVFYRDASE